MNNSSILTGLKTTFGGEWVGIRFNPDQKQTHETTPDKLRVCAAVQKGKSKTFVLPVDQIDCMGGQRCMGKFKSDHELIHHIYEETGIPLRYIQPIVVRTPSLSDIRDIEFGTMQSPDLVIAYCKPPVAMNVLRRWQNGHGQILPNELSSFLVTCGCVIAKAQRDKTLCISVGCPTSRNVEIFHENEVVVGMPVELAKNLLNGTH